MRGVVVAVSRAADWDAAWAETQGVRDKGGGMQRGCAMKNALEITRAKVLVMQPRVRRIAPMEEQREGTTGRVVAIAPGMTLERVWAVAETKPELEPAKSPVQPQPPVELAFYRKYTEGMLRRYVSMCMEAGRVPSLLGRELFRGQVTNCRVHSFEDVVIFCLDMETLLRGLPEEYKQVIKRIGMQRYSQGETAAMLGLSLRDCIRRYAKALDRLTEMLLEARMLNPQQDCPKSCQGGAGR